MTVDHELLVLLAKSLGLLCFVLASILVLVYALRPSARDTFRRAGESIIDDPDDRPIQPVATMSDDTESAAHGRR